MLAAYIEEVSLDTDFWARSNCMLFVGRWVAMIRPEYDVTRWLGAHRSLEEAMADVSAAGGMAALFAAEAARAGLIEIAPSEAEIGDVGYFEVTDVETRLGEVAKRLPARLYPACIRGPRHWCVRGGDGVGRVSAEGRYQPVRVWRV